MSPDYGNVDTFKAIYPHGDAGLVDEQIAIVMNRLFYRAKGESVIEKFRWIENRISRFKFSLISND